MWVLLRCMWVREQALKVKKSMKRFDLKKIMIKNAKYNIVYLFAQSTLLHSRTKNLTKIKALLIELTSARN